MRTSAASNARCVSPTSSNTSRPTPTPRRRKTRRSGACRFRGRLRRSHARSTDVPHSRHRARSAQQFGIRRLASNPFGRKLGMRRAQCPARALCQSFEGGPMTAHTYLEHGLSVLQARLRTPMSPVASGAVPEIHPFVTLSRETGAGATTLGRELIPLLDRELSPPGHSWVFLDRDLLTRALTQHQLPAQLADYLPEDRISEIRAGIGELVGLHPSLWQLEQKVSEAIVQLAHVGHVVFAGRASHLVTRHLAGGLHVRLIASRDTRIDRVATVLGCGRAQAAAHLDATDDARRRFVRANFDTDIDDPHLYDLVLNTDHLSAAAAARVVQLALRERIARGQTEGSSVSAVRS
ncbi:MAG: hypothetical protein C0518_01355 [Opitutus sp.]|nr:hypothetical protein [Opitutus sp.]